MIAEQLENLPSTVPYSVRNKLQSFVDVTLSRHTMLRTTAEEMRAASSALDIERARLAEMERNNHPQADMARDRVDRAREVHVKLAARVETLSPPWRDALALSENLRRYVLANAPQGFVIYQGIQPELRTDEKALDGLARAQRHTRELQDERRATLAAPFPSSDVKKVLREHLAARAEAMRPDLSGLVDRLEPVIRFPTTSSAIERYPERSDDRLYAIDPVGLIGLLFPLELQTLLEGEVDKYADDAVALSVGQRTARLAELDASILESERAEAAFAELCGVLPQPGIDPRAVLGLAASMPAPARS
ncbi:hypothetical protein ACVMAJ_000251 [Bradyrhizobium sp. USDA 4448]